MAKNSIIEYTGDGSTIQYAINFTGGYTLESHVFCQVNNEVDGSNDPIYRTLTFVSAGLVDIGGAVPGVGDPIVFQRITPVDAPVVDFEDGVTFTEEDIDAGFEQVLFGIQEAQDNLADAEDTEAAKIASEAAQAAAELARDAASVSETNAGASETNAGTSEANAAASAAAALVSENAASTSESNAAIYETNAGNSETAAALSEANAGNSETAAAASEGAAATSEANAAASAASAVASYDLFDDRFLGEKVSDPSLDNDNDALQVGALYFNTTSNAVRVYDGANWGDIANTVSRDLYEYTATSGQTVFSGADRHGNSLSTGNKFLNVHLNGARLTPTDDYTFDASSLTFNSALNLNDEVLIETLNTFEIIDGILTTPQVLSDGQKLQARTNIGAAGEDALGGFRNKIINGNFDIWQRATSQTATGYNSVDRWLPANVGSAMTTSQQPFTTGQTDVPNNPKYFIRHVVSSVAGAANLAESIHRIEGVETLSGKTATLTFYAKADSPKNMAFDFYQHFGTGGSPSADVGGIEAQQVSLTTSWQKFSLTISIPSISGKTLGTDGNDSVQLIFWFDAGTNSNSRTASLGQQSGTFDIARISLVEGDATEEDDPFSPRHIQQELALCQRYFCKSMRLETAPANSLTNTDCISGHLGAYASTHAYSPFLNFPQRMRGIPGITQYSSSAATTDGRWSIYTGAWVASTGNSADFVTELGFRVTVTGSWGAYSDNNAILFQVGWTADAEL